MTVLKSMAWLKSMACGLFVAAAAGGAVAQDEVELLRNRRPEDRPTLLVVGSAHFSNPGRDVINQEVEDVLSERRQAEILAVVEELAAFAPTRVAIEWPETAQAALDDAYAAFRAGARPLERSEAEQLGFRVAAELGHERVYAIDWNGYPPGDIALFDWPAWAESNGLGARLAAMSDPAAASSYYTPLAEQSIGAWLETLNEPERLSASHRFYFDIAAIGDEEVQPGANWVGHWYARNLRIFANLVDLAEDPEDRVLVIYGQGHAYLLRQFAEEAGAFELVDVADVLSGE